MSRPVETPEHKLLRRLLDKRTEPRQLASALGMSLVDMAYWLGQRHIRQMVRGLGSLVDFDAQIHLRAASLNRLSQIVEEGPANETIRRACADILKTRDTKTDRIDEEMAGLDVPNEHEQQELRAAMAEAGAATPQEIPVH